MPNNDAIASDIGKANQINGDDGAVSVNKYKRGKVGTVNLMTDKMRDATPLPSA